MLGGHFLGKENELAMDLEAELVRVRRRWVAASAQELSRLLALPLAERAKIPAEDLDDLFPAHRQQFTQALIDDARREGKRTATVAVVSRAAARASDAAAAATRPVAVAVAGAPGMAASAAASAELLLGSFWVPIRDMAAKIWWWLVPVALMLVASSVLPVHISPPRSAPAGGWATMVSNLAPTATALLLLAVGLLGQVPRRALRVCAVAQAVVAALAAFPMAASLVGGTVVLDGYALVQVAAAAMLWVGTGMRRNRR